MEVKTIADIPVLPALSEDEMRTVLEACAFVGRPVDDSLVKASQFIREVFRYTPGQHDIPHENVPVRSVVRALVVMILHNISFMEAMRHYALICSEMFTVPIPYSEIKDLGWEELVRTSGDYRQWAEDYRRWSLSGR
jgi:hypothetical protein